MKTAVVLVNLGGPDSQQEIRPFLFNIFNDSDLIKFPFGRKGQSFFAKVFSRMRASKSSELYAQIGGGSPVRYNTVKQARALEAVLQKDGEFRVFTAQRYWHPFISEVVEPLKHGNYEHIILLPLFPQYSNTTTLSIINEWVRNAQELPAPHIVQRFNCHPKYIQACIERILRKMEDFSERPHILFSADSIPESQVKKGDPYADEILETVDLIMENFHGYGHSLCYQSKMRPIKWLEPDIDSELHELYNRGIRNILVFPVGFVSENLETLYHLDIKIRDIAKKLGFTQYERADTVQDHPLFIECLQELVLELCE